MLFPLQHEFGIALLQVHPEMHPQTRSKAWRSQEEPALHSSGALEFVEGLFTFHAPVGRFQITVSAWVLSSVSSISSSLLSSGEGELGLPNRQGCCSV